MKFFLFLLFFLLLFDSPQGSTVSHKRSIRALNTTLETNFNGTYERRNPCTNAKIETTSYVASHEFRHHTEENNWSDYTNKCSSIISSFLQALGNLVHFNHKQNGIFNFHINTSISQKQVGHSKPGKRTCCDTLPTIIIEATDCELSPKSSCGNLSGEQLCQDQDKKEKDAICEDSLNEEIYRRNQTLSEKALRTPNFSQNSAISTPQCRNEDGIMPISSLDATAAGDGAKLLEAKNMGVAEDIFLPETETATSLEPDIPTTSTSLEAKNSPRGMIDSSESSATNFQTEPYSEFFKSYVTPTSQLDSENYPLSRGTEARTLTDPEKITREASESFNELSPSHPHYLPQTPHFDYENTPQLIADEESFYSNQFSDIPFREQQATAYSEQLFDDNLDRRVPDSKFLSDQRSNDSIIFPDQIQKASFSPREPIPTETYQPKNTAFEEFPIAIKQNEKSFQQSLQSGKQPDNFEKTQIWSNADLSSETTSYSSPNYLTEYEEAPFNQITNEELPKVPNLIPSEKFIDCDGQTPALGLSARYPKPSEQVQTKKNTPANTFDDQNSNEATDDRTQATDYPREFFKAQSVFEENLDSVTLDDSNDQGAPFSDDLSTSDIRKSLTDPTTWTLNERTLTKKPFYDANDNQFLPTPSPERPLFYFTDEPPFLTSKSQKLVPYYSEENSEERNTEKVIDTELSLPSEQYQSTSRPESQSLLNSPDQYDNGEEAEHMPESNFFDPLVQPDSDLTTNKSYLQSYSTTLENQANDFTFFRERASSPQYSTDTTSKQKFFSSYYGTSDYESFSPSKNETSSDEYLTTLPPERDSSENYQENLMTLNSYQDQPSLRKTSFPSAPEGEFASVFSGRILNNNAISSTPDATTLNSEESSNDVYTSRTPAPISFNDYQDILYSKPDVELSFTTPTQPFIEVNYEPATELNFTDDEQIYSDESQSTTPTVFGIDPLKQQPSPYSNQNSDLSLEQSLNFASDTSLPIQNVVTPKLQPHQLLEKREDSLPDVKPFSDRQYDDYPGESFKTKNVLNYDSEVPPDSSSPQSEQFPDGNVLVSGLSKQNPDSTPYFSKDFPQRSQTIFEPQPYTRHNNEELFPDRLPFRNEETTPSPDFSTADDYFEPITHNNYPKVDVSVKSSEDFDTKPQKYFSELFTTSVPPFSLPSEDFSSPSYYKTILENPLAQSQAEVSPASLDQSTDENLPPQFAESAHAFSATFRDANKFDSDFQTEKFEPEPFDSETAGEESTQSATPVYKNQSDQPFSYTTAAESLTPIDEKQQYVAADRPKIQEVFFPKQKYFSKLPLSDLPEHNSTTSEYQPTDSYNINDSDNLESLPVVDQQTRETTDQESTLNSSVEDFRFRFSDFHPKEPAADFFPSAERPLIQKSDSTKEQTEFYLNNQQSSSNVFEPQSLISTIGNDQFRLLEFQPSSIPESESESAPSFSDDKPSAILSEKTPLDIPSQAESLILTRNQKLQSNDFQLPDSLAFTSYSQPQKVPPYSSYHLEDFPKDSQSSTVEDPGSVVSLESQLTEPDINRNINRSPNRQTAAEFNTFQSPQRRAETYNQFSSSAPLQSTEYDDKEVVPNNDHSSALKSKSQIQPSVYDYNKQDFSFYSGPNFSPKPQLYQSEPSLQTLEEHSDITPAPQREIPFDIDETAASSIPEISSLFVNGQTEYSSSLAPEQLLKTQSSYDKLQDIPGENIAEKPILLPPKIGNFKNIPFFEVKSDKSMTRGSYPDHTEAYERDAAGTDYNQPKSKELDYLDGASNSNFDVSTPDLSNPTQSSVTSPTSDSVPNMQFRPNDFTSFFQSPSSTSYQLNSNSNEPPQRNSAIPLRYSQSEKEISFVTDNVSPQARLTKIEEIFPTTQLQPQTTLNFANQFSDDNTSEQLANSPDRQYQITPNTIPSSEFELIPSMKQSVSTQRNVADLATSDKDASNQPPLLFRSQTRLLDVMTGTPDQNQNNFDSKLSSQASDSPLHTTTTTQSQHEPSIINQERLYNSQERFSPYNLESQPIVNSNNRPVSVEYQQDPPIHPTVYDQLSSNVSLREQGYFSEAFPFPEAQRSASSRYGPQTLDSRDKFQTQPYITRSSRDPTDVLSINSDKNKFPSAVPKHSAIQRSDSQPYSINYPNQYPNYNARPRAKIPTGNFYNNERARQSNRVSQQYFTSDAVQDENSFENSLPINLDQHPQKSEVARSLDQTIKNADSHTYDDYDHAFSSQLPNEKFLEYNEDITPEFYAENFQTFQAHRQQNRDLTEEDPREVSDDFLTEADPPMGFSQKADPHDFQDRSSPDNEPFPFTSPPAEKEPHSNPLLQTLESHLTLPFEEQLRIPASYASFEDTEKESLSDSFPFDPQNQNDFRDVSAVPPYSEERDSEIDFVNYQRSQPPNGVDMVQDVTNIQQPDSHALVSDPNIPSNKPGEDCVSWSGQNPAPLLCPFDPVLKGNMTAPSYYILISKLPVHDDEEQFQVEKVYLGDGTPLNCTLNSGETFPTSLCTPIPFSAASAVKLRTKSDFA